MPPRIVIPATTGGQSKEVRNNHGSSGTALASPEDPSARTGGWAGSAAEGIRQKGIVLLGGRSHIRYLPTHPCARQTPSLREADSLPEFGSLERSHEPAFPASVAG